MAVVTRKDAEINARRCSLVTTISNVAHLSPTILCACSTPTLWYKFLSNPMSIYYTLYFAMSTGSKLYGLEEDEIISSAVGMFAAGVDTVSGYRTPAPVQA